MRQKRAKKTNFSPEKLAYVLMPIGAAILLTGQFLRNDTLQMIGGFILLPFLVLGLPLLFLAVLGFVTEVFEWIRGKIRDESPASKTQSTGETGKPSHEIQDQDRQKGESNSR